MARTTFTYDGLSLSLECKCGASTYLVSGAWNGCPECDEWTRRVRGRLFQVVVGEGDPREPEPREAVSALDRVAWSSESRRQAPTGWEGYGEAAALAHGVRIPDSEDWLWDNEWNDWAWGNEPRDLRLRYAKPMPTPGRK